MEKLKRISILLLVGVILIFSISGCVTGAGEGSKPKESTTSDPSPEPEELEVKGLYPFKGNPTVDMLLYNDSKVQTAGFADWGETDLYKYWQEQTGIDINLTVLPDREAMLLQLATGEYPDILLMYSTSYTGGLAQMIEDEIAINLMDYKEYMPDYYKIVSQVKEYKDFVTFDDGGIYFFATLTEVGNPTLSWRGMVLREDFLDDLNIGIPTTNDEFYETLVKFRDDKGCEAPYSGNMWDSIFNDGFFTSEYGLVSCSTFMKDEKYVHGSYEDEYKDVLAYANKLYKEGLFDRNFQTTNEATSQASLLAGNTGAHYTTAARINTIWNKSEDENFKLVGIGSLKGPNGEKPYFSQSDPLTPDRYCGFVTEDCKNKEAATAFFNWLYTEDGQLTANFGVKDLCWTYKDGVPTFTDYMTNHDSGSSLDNMLYVQAMMNRPTIYLGSMAVQRFARPEQVVAQERWADSGVLKYSLPVFSINDLDLSQEATSLKSDINTYIKECRTQFITGEMNIETEFSTYLNTLKGMEMDRFIEIHQIALDEYLKK